MYFSLNSPTQPFELIGTIFGAPVSRQRLRVVGEKHPPRFLSLNVTFRATGNSRLHLIYVFQQLSSANYSQLSLKNYFIKANISYKSRVRTECSQQVNWYNEVKHVDASSP